MRTALQATAAVKAKYKPQLSSATDTPQHRSFARPNSKERPQCKKYCNYSPLQRLNITNPSLEGKFSALRTLRLHTKHNTPSSVRLQCLSRARLCACLQALLRTGSEVSSKLRQGFPSECHVQRLILWSTIPSILANYCRVFSFNFC